MSNEDKQGRKLEQITKDGTGSAASMGTGGTGRSDTRTEAEKGYDEAVNRPWEGSQQSAGRTDDLLSDGSDADRDGQGFAGGTRDQDAEGSGDMRNRTGAGAGNQQSGQAPDQQDDRQQSLSGGGRANDPTGLQGAAGNQQSGS
ncbi:hypothetical protein GJV26_06845 [Massilia dura]|uniref:Uncharacterized protein n=1 Tax=Pseudoduganella dura TaxID=321982 RepID=A0A6I3X618_9BURK|nr:hypothetical protein [Pseudoduganella dura]MUI12194.1 hypothetical protein [Pseudoduganella dura]GGY05892.1 hypothetical protein GCM10007386_40700 [Pseudoduganella dura]